MKSSFKIGTNKTLISSTPLVEVNYYEDLEVQHSLINRIIELADEVFRNTRR